MRAHLLFVAVLLAACGQPASTTSTATAPDMTATASTASAGDPMTTGLMGGMSTTAAGEVAALTVAADALAFSDADGEETFSAPTTYLSVADASSQIAAGGDTFAGAAASSTPDVRVELRRLTAPVNPRFCGEGIAATHVALVHAEPMTALTLVVFSGADAPGPSARDSAVCATYLYGVD
ncbi:hypothetical protein [Terricaulis sp.]|uniref:hypothetical protein n=1 Tax=Terricaulis sp. TaxID=2768686 RepID=UPI0037839575